MQGDQVGGGPKRPRSGPRTWESPEEGFPT